MTTKPVEITPTNESQAAPQCPHYWVIQPADGPISEGVCQVCGQTKEFKNYVEASTWGDDKATSRGHGSSADVVSSVASFRVDEDTEE